MCVCLLLVAFCFHSWFWHAGPYEARVHQDTKNIEGLGFTIGELRSYSDLHFNGHISFMDMKSSFSLHGDILVKIGRKLVDNVWGVFIALHCAVSTIWGVFPFHGFVCEWGQPHCPRPSSAGRSSFPNGLHPDKATCANDCQCSWSQSVQIFKLVVSVIKFGSQICQLNMMAKFVSAATKLLAGRIHYYSIDTDFFKLLRSCVSTDNFQLLS